MNTLRKIPLLRAAIPFATGISCALSALLNESCYWVLLCSGIIIYATNFIWPRFTGYAWRFLSGLGLSLIVLSLGALSVLLTQPAPGNIQALEQTESVYRISVASPVEVKKKSIAVEARVLGVMDSRLKGLFYLDNAIASAGSLEVGDELVLKCRLIRPDSPKNPLQFDYRNYLELQGIYFQCFIRPAQVIRISRKNTFSITGYSHKIRTYIVDGMREAGLTGDELGIAGALVIGEERNLSQEIMSAYAASGAMHVISVSGLHIGIVFLVIRTLFAPLLSRSGLKKWVVPLIIGLLWTYSFITGLSPCVQRAALMFSFVALGNTFGRNSNIYNMLGASALVLLIIDPCLVMNVGFQLSYLALFGIVIFQPPIQRLVFVKNKYLFKVWEITAVAIAAQLTTAILGMYYFHQFPIYFLLANLAVIPLSFVMLVIGVGFVLVCWIPGPDLVLGWCLQQSTWMLNQSLLWLERLPGSVVQGITLSAVEAWMLYALLVMCSVAFLARKKYALIACLSGTVVMLSLSTAGLQNSSAEALRIYAVPNTTAIALHYPQKQLLTDSVSPQIGFFAGNALAAAGIHKIRLLGETPGIRCSRILPDENRVFTGRKETLVLVTQPPNPELYREVEINYLLIENSLFNWKTILQFGARKVILGNKLSGKMKKKLRMYLENKGVTVFELSETGSIAIQ
ncbi:MAG: ComEC/Rec2 family competence protein [Bacteroidota bacterium]